MYVFIYVCKDVCVHTCECMYNFVARKVCYHVLVVIFPMPHDRGCEIKIIVIIDIFSNRCQGLIKRHGLCP